MSAVAFDPADAGTPEAVWLDFLASAPEWRPSQGRIIVVSPHPDDEVLGAGGLIHSCAMAGQPVDVISVTDGEAAYAAWADLHLVRRAELKEALRKLSPTHVSVTRIGLPDGRVAEHANRLRNALLSAVDASTTLVAPFERDGHPDHDAVGQVCRDLARAQGIPIARYPVWTWHHAAPSGLADASCVKFTLSPDARRAKARALECFSSQLKPPSDAPVVPAHVLTYFHRPFEVFLL